MSVDQPPTIHAERLDLVWLSPDLIELLIGGDRMRAELEIGAALPTEVADANFERFLRMRLGQMRADQEEARWLARFMVLRDEHRVVGHLGFHGKPDEEGIVEVGYTVYQPYRRRGLAWEAVNALFDWAGREHGITRFRASVSPTNQPSLSLVRKLGMVRSGEHIDAEDGLEWEFLVTRPVPPDGEMRAGASPP
jgi:RimJ/RimL family protein N-acetyltransferase